MKKVDLHLRKLLPRNNEILRFRCASAQNDVIHIDQDGKTDRMSSFYIQGIRFINEQL